MREALLKKLKKLKFKIYKIFKRDFEIYNNLVVFKKLFKKIRD